MGSTKYPLVPPPGGGTPNLPQPGQPAPMRADEFRPGSTANWTEFNFKSIDPPSALYLQRDDQLILLVSSNIVGESVFFQGRFLRVPEPQGGQPSDAQPGKPTGAVFDRGIIEPFSERVAPATTFTNFTVVRQFAEGYLLSVAAVPQVALTRGRTFVKAFILRPPTNLQLHSTILFADYASGTVPVGWPGGRQLQMVEGPGWRHSVQQANPAAGTDFAFTMVAGQRMAIISFTAQFVASAAVANRNIEVIVDDGANVVWRTSVPAVVTAGQTVQVSATGSNQPTGIVTTDFTLLIPPGLILSPGWRIRTATTGIQAADQWSNIWFNVDEAMDGF